MSRLYVSPQAPSTDGAFFIPKNGYTHWRMKKDKEQIDDVEFVESDEEGAQIGASDKIKKLKEKITQLEKEKQEYLDGWQRARADYANLLKTSS